MKRASADNAHPGEQPGNPEVQPHGTLTASRRPQEEGEIPARQLEMVTASGQKSARKEAHPADSTHPEAGKRFHRRRKHLTTKLNRRPDCRDAESAGQQHDEPLRTNSGFRWRRQTPPAQPGQPGNPRSRARN